MANWSVCAVVILGCCTLSLTSTLYTGSEELPSGRVPDKSCIGTFSGFSISGDAAIRYRRLVTRYTNCTHVFGNLELTFLSGTDVNYDLSFLQTIRYVSGYLLILVASQVRTIPLVNLELIRGNYTFSFQGREYGLIVLLNYPRGSPSQGLAELQLPSLKEITRGSVAFQGNPSLGYIDTIDWRTITRHRVPSVFFWRQAYNGTVSRTVDRSGCPGGRMWAQGMCQAALEEPSLPCSSSCNGRCFGPGSQRCCHVTCAAGCDGPSNQECHLCKDYVYHGGCEGFCPAQTRREGQSCIDI